MNKVPRHAYSNMKLAQSPQRMDQSSFFRARHVQKKGSRLEDDYKILTSSKLVLSPLKNAGKMRVETTQKCTRMSHESSK